MKSPEIVIHLPEPHAKQAEFVNCTAKRIVVRAGRRGGKTYGMAIRAVQKFLEGRRVLYAAPTSDQLQRFWAVVTRALDEPIQAGVFRKNESEHYIETPKTDQRIRAKTAWNADSLRGDFADELILDEYQLMNEDAWGVVGAPMLLDNNGNAVFIYTPPSLHSRSASKADDPQHAAKFFKKAKQKEKDDPARWATFHFSSRDNPTIDAEAIEELAGDMTALAYRMEIEAEDVDQAPGALWTRETLESGRVLDAEVPDLDMVVVAVDPSTGDAEANPDIDECGIVVTGKGYNHGYVLADKSLQASPAVWAKEAVDAYHLYKANKIVAEANNGGEMVRLTIQTVDPKVPVTLVHASRGKHTRAEPVAAVYEHARGHHVGVFPKLEDEMCLWMPGQKSPNRMDALVWGFTALDLFKWKNRSLTDTEAIEERLAKTAPNLTLKAIERDLAAGIRDKQGALSARTVKVEQIREQQKREGIVHPLADRSIQW